jgi:hypothetical protein
MTARTDAIQELIPRPPMDVSCLGDRFSKMVANQWLHHVPPTLRDAPLGSNEKQAAKVRFIAEMYGRACYSMLLLSARAPLLIRILIRIAQNLPINRQGAIGCAGLAVSFLKLVVPYSVHRQLALMSTLMAVMDIVLDEAAPAGQGSVLRIASMLSRHPEVATNIREAALGTLTRSIRARESEWQMAYWDTVLFPAVRKYCAAEAFAASNVPDTTGLGHRWVGIEAAIKGMWYVLGPHMGLSNAVEGFEQPGWNSQQQWMADTSLLMQMVDDWIDQDVDRGLRPTPVLAGAWTLQTIKELYARTMTDLRVLFEECGIRSKILQDLFRDLYADYMHRAVEAMKSGSAA